jgi:hypothetical protein
VALVVVFSRYPICGTRGIGDTKFSQISIPEIAATIKVIRTDFQISAAVGGPTERG